MEARRFCFLYNFCHHAGQRARRIPVYLHRRRTAHACSSTIPIPTFAKKHCSKSCSRRSSWRTTMAGRSTRTTCARAPCWKTRSCCARRLRRSAFFLFIDILRHFIVQRAVSQISRGFILLKKGLCKTQSPFFCSYATEKIPSENENASEQDALFFVSLTVFEGQLGQFAQFILRELFIGQTKGIIGNQHR